MVSSGQEDFLRKMKLLSMIKGRLIELGKDPGIIERIMMDEFDGKTDSGISDIMKECDPDNPSDFDKLIEQVMKKV